MRWLRRDVWKVVIATSGLLILLVFMVLIPLSASAYEDASGPRQATPTVDVTATMTALNEEKLRQEVQQLKSQNDPDFLGRLQTNATLLSTLLVVLGGLFGLGRWVADRRDAQDKELKDRQAEREKRSEERFQRVVTDLGSERKEPRIAAATLLLTFLQPGYEQFYRQIFDLATAYLQSLEADTSTSNPLPLDPLRRGLIDVFKQSFLYVRGEWKEKKARSLEYDMSDYDRLGAVNIQLDNAYLSKADLRGIWMREASLKRAHLYGAKFTGAHLKGANFTEAYLEKALFTKSDCSRAIFTRARLREVNFVDADISRADFSEANLTDANPEAASSLKGTKLYRAIGLKKEQLATCKAKGAFIDEDTTTSPPQPTASPPSQSNNPQTPSASPAQIDTPPPSTDGSSC